MKPYVLIIWTLVFSWFTQSVSAAVDMSTTLDLSSLTWTVSVEGSEGFLTQGTFDDALETLIKIYEPGDVALFQVSVPLNEQHLATPHAIVLGPVHINSEVYFDGILIGASGLISHQSRDNFGFAPGRETQLFLIPSTISEAGTYALTIRAQSRVYRPGPVRGPRAIMPLRSAFETVTTNNQYLITVESFWVVASLLIVVFTLSRIGFRWAPQSRDRWLPFVLIFGLLSLGNQTFLFYSLGWVTPLTIRIGDSYPGHLALLLHIFAALGVEREVWQTALISTLAGIIGGLAWWDGSLAFVTAREAVVTISAVVLVGLCSYGAFKAMRADTRVSPWTYASIVWLVAFVPLYAFLPQQMDLVADPAELLLVIWMIILTLAAADHAKWDREAVSTLTRELLSSGEKERGRLARELHDGLSHRLALTRMRLESLLRNSNNLDDVLEEPIAELSASSEEIAAIAEGLRPLSLTDGDIQIALQAFAERWNRMSDIKVETNIRASHYPDEEAQLHLLRITQEAVQNAVRHGEATKIRIVLTSSHNMLTLEIRDNGSGFQSELLLTIRGIGLTAMQQRLALLNGSLNVESRPGQGTTIRARVPLK